MSRRFAFMKKRIDLGLRTTGNQRRYQRAMLRRIAIIKAAQQVGISLKQIKETFATLPKQQIASKKDWQTMSQQWQGQLDQQIMMLLQLRQQLDQCIGCGCLSLEQCPLRNPDDCLAEQAMGAHFQEILFLLNQKDLADRGSVE